MSQNNTREEGKDMTDIRKIGDLPTQFNILTLRNKKTGVWVAQLLDYDVNTEAESYYELVFNVNDLIYAFFDVPKKLQSKITYLPTQPIYNKEVEQINTSIEEKVKFNLLVAPKLARYKHA